MRQRDYFISYTKVDERWALWIAWLLNQEGYSFTIQALDFAPGRDFMHEMRSAMRACRQTIAVLSPEYLKSQYATAEINAALVSDPMGSKGRLIPVRVKKFVMKDLLASRIYIDLIDKNDETARHDFLAGIAAARLQRP